MHLASIWEATQRLEKQASVPLGRQGLPSGSVIQVQLILTALRLLQTICYHRSHQD